MSPKVKRIVAIVLSVVAVLALARAFWGGEDVADLAESEDAADRLEAAVLMDRGASDPGGVLAKLAADADPTVALQSIKVMGHRPTPEHRRTLTGLVDTAAHPRVRSAAAAALGNDPQVNTRQLVDLLDEGTDPVVRAGAAKGLARLAKHKKNEAAPVLVESLRHPDPNVRKWAITGVYNISGHEFPGYDAEKPPHLQAEAIGFIEAKLRSKGLIK